MNIIQRVKSMKVNELLLNFSVMVMPNVAYDTTLLALGITITAW